VSFLRDYLDYATGNEAPELFHVWSGFTALSAAISRKVWLPFGKRALFPNIYTLLVGDAGNGKSVAMYFCKLLLSNLGDVPISGSIETPPGLWRYMGGNPKADPPIQSPVAFLAAWPDGQIRECHPMTILANEFVDFISIDDSGWIHALNNIYDEDVYRYRTKNQGEDILIGPYIVLLGGLTSDVAHDLQKARIISTGLARRTIFQYGERRWDDPHPILDETAMQKESFKMCLDYLTKLRKLHGPFSWDEDTKDWWRQWYIEHNSTVLQQPLQTRSWFASKPDQVLKIGMLTSLSEGTTLKLEIGHLQTAVYYFTELEKDLYRVFGGIGRNELAGVAVKIHEFVQAQPAPTPTRVVKFNFFSMCKPPAEFEECVKYLVESGRLKQADFTVGPVTEPVLATPEAMVKFAADVKTVQPAAVVQLLERQGFGREAGPLAGRPQPQNDSPLPANPTAAQPVGEIVIEQLPKVEKKEG
jgi:hypothetical protein